MHSAAITYEAAVTFGRQIAQFRQLITVLAAVSVVIWTIVLITLAGRGIYYVHYRRILGRSTIPPD